MSDLAPPVLSPTSANLPDTRHSFSFHRRGPISFAAPFPHHTLLLSSSSCKPTASPSKQGSNWRWWHILSLVVGLLGLVESFVLLSYNFHASPHHAMQSSRIAVRQYPSIPYNHIVAQPIERGTRVYHVAKEFGPAIMSDLGSTVTSLAAAQQRSNDTEVSIVMPFYSFLRSKFPVQRLVVLTIEVEEPAATKKHERNPLETDENDIIEAYEEQGPLNGHRRQKKSRQRQRRTHKMEFQVWQMQYAFGPAETTIELVDGVNKTVVHKPNVPDHDQVTVYMIGPGNLNPFKYAFRARNPRQMNDENNAKINAALPPDWRDQYFCRAAAAFLAYQATAVNEESLFAPVLRPAPRVDVIHMHGAPVSSVARILDAMRGQERLGPKPPVFVYTLHDAASELRHAHSIDSIRLFSDPRSRRAPWRSQAAFRTQTWMMYTTGLGIDHADAVTFVGQSLAADLVEGRRALPLKELTMDGVLDKAARGRFFGINGGLDIHTRGPFQDTRLTSRNLAFPNFAWQLLQDTPSRLNGTAPVVWPLSSQPNDYVSTAKDRAKRYLIRRSVLTNEDAMLPLVLMASDVTSIGSAEIATLTLAARKCVQQGMVLVMVTPPPADPVIAKQFDDLVALSEEGPGRAITLITDQQHRQLDIFLRAAADVWFVPLFNDQAAEAQITEGLLFAASVITPRSSAKDLAFLINRPRQARPEQVQYDSSGGGAIVTSKARNNAYLYDPTEAASLSDAILDAAADYKRISENKVLREECLLRMLKCAVDQSVSRPGGTVDEYNGVYALALQDRPIPDFSRHVIEEEQALLYRLKHDRLIV